MQLGSFVTTERALHHGIKVHQSALPTKNEDRTVVLEFEHGTMIAIFDGHYSCELAEFASTRIPRLVAERFDPTARDADISQAINQIFQDFDSSLIEKVTKLFAPGEDWSDIHWTDRGNVHEVIGYGKQDPQFREGRLAVVGTTALIGIIDKQKRNIWVVSLGDSDAVCGRMQDGKLNPIIMSDQHNCQNVREVEQLTEEHPGEEQLVQGNRVLGLLAVTRALGDHQLKAHSRLLVTRVLQYFYLSPILPISFEHWERDGHQTPPYLSASPSVRRYDLLPGDMLMFASDGLRDSMNCIPAADRWDIIMSLVNGENPEQLGHACILPGSGVNEAELVIKNALFGQDTDKMAKELADPDRDDISVVVVDLGWEKVSSVLRGV
ncbi:phosphatase 2C-like domain-containing protein [Mycena leptocephala]|nr:phosphatase 2C-like domain-containing protein [Mycena leptocephala]